VGGRLQVRGRWRAGMIAARLILVNRVQYFCNIKGIK
jgi:hypothetical protein